MSTDGIQSILEKHADDRFSLISILEDVQAKYSYLPAEALRSVAERTGRPLVDVYAVATFYHAFSLKPRGKHVVSVCLGTACHVRGARVVAGEMERRLGVKPGETSKDRQVTLETVNCLGACALGPVVVLDGHYHPKMDTQKVTRLAAKMRDDTQVTRSEGTAIPLKVSCPRCNHSLMNLDNLLDGLPTIHVTLSFGQFHGWLRLSSLYGSFAIESEHPIPLDQVVQFFCPHCHGELVGASDCPECGAPMVPMIVRGGGVVQICARRGCKSHRLDLDAANL